jgi:hypothetical protein
VTPALMRIGGVRETKFVAESAGAAFVAGAAAGASCALAGWQHAIKATASATAKQPANFRIKGFRLFINCLLCAWISRSAKML